MRHLARTAAGRRAISSALGGCGRMQKFSFHARRKVVLVLRKKKPLIQRLGRCTSGRHWLLVAAMLGQYPQSVARYFSKLRQRLAANLTGQYGVTQVGCGACRSCRS